MRAPGLAKSTWNLFLASRGTIYLLDLRHPLHNLNLPTYYIHSRPARSYLVLPNPHRYTHLNHVKVLTAQALSPFEYILLARALLAERRMAQSESVNMAQNESNNTGQVVQNGSNNREQVRDEQPREIWFTDDIWQLIVDYNNDYGTARALQMVNRRIGSLVPGRGGWWRLRQSRRYFMFRAEQNASNKERDVYVCGWCNTYKHRSEFADDQVTGDRRKGAVGAYQRHCLTCAV